MSSQRPPKQYSYYQCFLLPLELDYRTLFLNTTYLSHRTWRTHSGRDLDASSLPFSIHSTGRFFINRIKTFKAAPSACYIKSSQINNPFHSLFIFVFKQIKHRIQIPRYHSQARISLTLVSSNTFLGFCLTLGFYCCDINHEYCSLSSRKARTSKDREQEPVC